MCLKITNLTNIGQLARNLLRSNNTQKRRINAFTITRGSGGSKPAIRSY